MRDTDDNVVAIEDAPRKKPAKVMHVAKAIARKDTAVANSQKARERLAAAQQKLAAAKKAARMGDDSTIGQKVVAAEMAVVEAFSALERATRALEYEAKQPPEYPPFDPEIVYRAAGIGCTYDEIATIIGMTVGQLQTLLRNRPDLKQLLDDGRNVGHETLRRHQWSRATEAQSDTMLIWLGKQMLGQRDKTDAQHTGANGEALIPVLNLTINRD
jgi:hypothetical protein